MDPEEKLTETLNTQIKQVSQLSEYYRNSVRNGKLGKTATFWLTYLDLVRMQHVIHTSIQGNDFQKRVLGWKYFLSFYFALNYSNYVRYGSHYVQVFRVNRTNVPWSERYAEMQRLVCSTSGKVLPKNINRLTWRANH